MTHEEHHDILHILTTETWAVRKKLLEYLKTVTLEPLKVPEVLEEIPEESAKVEPWKDVQAQYLSGKDKVEYPEYTGEPTI